MDRVKKNKKKGFTLVELMIVIVIMVILAAAAAPVFTGYVKKAAAAKHLADCHSIATAVTSVITEKAAKDVGKDGKITGVDAADILGEVIVLSGIDKDKIVTTENPSEGQYTFAISEKATSASATNPVQTVTSVTYCDGESYWVFNPVDGSYVPKKISK